MQNPSEVQFIHANNEHQTPLVLIHDGGGTIVSYHFLDDLERPVWGIANPRFDDGEGWEGGLPEMATEYIKLIRTIIPKGTSFLLGGWSLGGMLSLEVSRQLVGDPDLRIKGMVFIDSTYPNAVLPGETAPNGKYIMPFNIQFNSNTREKTRELVRLSFEHSGRMARDWKVPTWNPAAGIIPPPTVLLRAVDSVPIGDDAPANAVSRVDVFRDKPLLGWENYGYPLLDCVVPIQGHHFNVFYLDNIDSVSRELKTACDLLDRGAIKKKGGIDSRVPI